MGVRITTSKSQIAWYITESIRIMQNEIKRTLMFLGEQTIVKARDRSGSESWYDQTGNLRSSIGYAIYENGKKEIESAFKIIKNGSKGARVGREMIDDLASIYSDTYALVVVAGMNYADKVEAMDNKDVLASAENFARTKINAYMIKAIKEATKKISQL